MITCVAALTGEVVMANTGEIDVPPATVTDAGTPTLGSLLASDTITPVDGAGPLSVTLLFAAIVTPPTTDGGDKVTLASPSGATFN